MPAVVKSPTFLRTSVFLLGAKAIKPVLPFRFQTKHFKPAYSKSATFSPYCSYRPALSFRYMKTGTQKLWGASHFVESTGELDALMDTTSASSGEPSVNQATPEFHPVEQEVEDGTPIAIDVEKGNSRIQSRKSEWDLDFLLSYNIEVFNQIRKSPGIWPKRHNWKLSSQSLA